MECDRTKAHDNVAYVCQDEDSIVRLANAVADALDPQPEKEGVRYCLWDKL